MPGFIADRLRALWRRRCTLVSDGMATTGEIDDAERFGAGLLVFMGTDLHLADWQKTPMRHSWRNSLTLQCLDLPPAGTGTTEGPDLTEIDWETFPPNNRTLTQHQARHTANDCLLAVLRNVRKPKARRFAFIVT